MLIPWHHQYSVSDNMALGRDLDIGLYPVEVPKKLVGTKPNNQLEAGSSKFSEQIDKGMLDLKSDTPASKLKHEAVNLTGINAKTGDLKKEKPEYETANRVSNILDINSKLVMDSKDLPSLELSLKRLRAGKENGIMVQDDRNVLRRSDSSAFSRYNTFTRNWQLLIYM